MPGPRSQGELQPGLQTHPRPSLQKVVVVGGEGGGGGALSSPLREEPGWLRRGGALWNQRPHTKPRLGAYSVGDLEQSTEPLNASVSPSFQRNANSSHRLFCLDCCKVKKS